MEVKADLHIHTVLSPCASLDMSPKNIVEYAKAQGLKIIGITDHNSTLQCKTVQKIAKDSGIFVLAGAEITSREEVHNLVFFETFESLEIFQEFIDKNQPHFKNDISFGFQAVVDENDVVIKEIDYYLGMALNVGIDEIEEKVHQLGGLYIPAHINRPRFGLISQLGFVPNDIKADALEIFNRSSASTLLQENKYLEKFSLLKNSDAHTPENIGIFFNTFDIENISFKEVKMALLKEDNRKVSIF